MPMPRYITTAELAERVRTPVETCRYWRHVGKGPASVKFGRKVLYAMDDVEAWEREARGSAAVA